MGGRFTVLGSGTAVPLPDRGPAGYLLEAGGERVLFDSGSGTLQRLAAAGVSPAAVDRVFFTHYHLDHLMDLPTLLFALKDPALDLDRDLPVYGPPGLRRIAAGLEALFESWVKPASTKPGWCEIDSGWSESFPFGTVTAANTRHVPGSLAYRVSLPGGGDLVYTGDTGYSAAVVDLARGVDLFVCEAALPEAAVSDFHSSPALAGRMAAEAGVQCLMLTHFYPAVLETDRAAAVREYYGGRLLLAEDLMAFEIEDS